MEEFSSTKVCSYKFEIRWNQNVNSLERNLRDTYVDITQLLISIVKISFTRWRSTESVLQNTRSSGKTELFINHSTIFHFVLLTMQPIIIQNKYSRYILSKQQSIPSLTPRNNPKKTHRDTHGMTFQ